MELTQGLARVFEPALILIDFRFAKLSTDRLREIAYDATTRLDSGVCYDGSSCRGPGVAPRASTIKSELISRARELVSFVC